MVTMLMLLGLYRTMDLYAHVAGGSAMSQEDIENVQRVVTGATVRLKCSVQSRG